MIRIAAQSHLANQFLTRVSEVEDSDVKHFLNTIGFVMVTKLVGHMPRLVYTSFIEFLIHKCVY